MKSLPLILLLLLKKFFKELTWKPGKESMKFLMKNCEKNR